MSNTSPTSSPISVKEKKIHYLQLIAEGEVETNALMAVNLQRSTYIRLLLDDADFAKAVETARKHRAEHWIAKIASKAEEFHEKDDVPGEKLIFDKLQYLAKADNPDRYGNSAKGANININLGEFKMLAPAEAKLALAQDPFALDAEFEVIEDEGDLL